MKIFPRHSITSTNTALALAIGPLPLNPPIPSYFSYPPNPRNPSPPLQPMPPNYWLLPLITISVPLNLRSTNHIIKPLTIFPTYYNPAINKYHPLPSTYSSKDTPLIYTISPSKDPPLIYTISPFRFPPHYYKSSLTTTNQLTLHNQLDYSNSPVLSPFLLLAFT